MTRSAADVDLDLITTFGRLVEAATSLERELGRELRRRAGIPHPWLEVMLRISRAPRGRVRMTELAAQVALTTGGVTKLLDRMVATGLVEREGCPSDGRVTWATLTPAGYVKLEEAAQVHSEQLREVFAGWERAELDTLDRLLDRLRAQPA